MSYLDSVNNPYITAQANVASAYGNNNRTVNFGELSARKPAPAEVTTSSTQQINEAPLVDQMAFLLEHQETPTITEGAHQAYATKSINTPKGSTWDGFNIPANNGTGELEPKHEGREDEIIGLCYKA